MASAISSGEEPGPCLAIRLHDRSLHTRLALNPELYAGEAYIMTLTFEDGSNVGDLMELFSVNRSGLRARLQKLLRQVRLGLRLAPGKPGTRQ
jgi:cyclopropane-fatty-acyl-phospholipid synthase